jgi:glycosyltransferase involved in cell wall biosynthesis
LRTADFVLAVSEELRQQEVALGAPPERTRTILNGYDSSIFFPQDRRKAREALKLGQEEEIVLYVGSLIAPKGLRELLQAARSLHSRRPNLRIYCIGEGPLRQELEGAASFFLLPGRTDSAGVAQWMAAADIFCLPSYSEGCPNVLIEAIACGRPVIATNVGGIPEILNEQRGALIPPQDAAALEEALLSALSRAWDPASLAGGFVRPWETVAEETLQVCRQLLQTQ